MSDRHFVDTNILMYAHDTSAGGKHVLAKVLVQELREHRSGVLSTQVLQELVVLEIRKPVTADSGFPVALLIPRQLSL